MFGWRRKTSTTVEERLGPLLSQLDAVRHDMKGMADGIGDIADDRVRRAVKNAEKIAARSVKIAEDATAHWAGDVTGWTGRNLALTRKSVRSQPLSALLISLVAGALVASIFDRL